MSKLQKILVIIAGLAALAACRQKEPQSYLVEYDQSQVLVKVINPPPGGNTADLADLIGQKAIEYRRELALEFIGEEVPPFRTRMPITATLGGGDGSTSYVHSSRSGPDEYEMYVTGRTVEQLIASTLKHEVMHTVTSTHVQGPSPTWLDEGLSSIIELEETVDQLRHALNQSLQGRRSFIPFRDLLPMTDYPQDMLTVYYQGTVMADYLHRRADGGSKKLMAFVKKAVESSDGGSPDLQTWNRLLSEFYQIRDADALEAEVKAWFLAGSKNNYRGEEALSLNEASLYLAAGQDFPMAVVAAPNSSFMRACLIPADLKVSNCNTVESQALNKQQQKSQGKHLFYLELQREPQAGDQLIIENLGSAKSFSFEAKQT